MFGSPPIYKGWYLPAPLTQRESDTLLTFRLMKLQSTAHGLDDYFAAEVYEHEIRLRRNNELFNNIGVTK